MKKWRRRMFPTQPNIILEMGRLLKDPENKKLLDYGKGTLQVETITDADVCHHLIVRDQALIDEYFRDVPNLRSWIDGTFQTTAKLEDAYQTLTVMLAKDDHVSFNYNFFNNIFIYSLLTNLFMINFF